MTKKRSGDAWMPAADYGRAMPRFTLNLLVRDVQKSIPFYKDVLAAKVQYADADFAALSLQGVDFMLHADHTYDHHPLFERLKVVGARGTGAELRVMGIDPDAAESGEPQAGLLDSGPKRDNIRDSARSVAPHSVPKEKNRDETYFSAVRSCGRVVARQRAWHCGATSGETGNRF